MLETQCAVDQLAAQRERESCNLGRTERGSFRKSRSYNDFSDVTDSEGGDLGSEAKDLPSSKRRAGSTENLLHLEALADGRLFTSRLPPVGTLPAQVTSRVVVPVDLEPAQPSSPPLTASRLASVAAAPLARDCDGSCGCPGQVARADAFERRFTLSHAATSPPELLASSLRGSPPGGGAARLGSSGREPSIERCASDAAAATARPPRALSPAVPLPRSRSPPEPASRGASPPAPPARPCSLFLSSSQLSLVEPPSLISPSPAASLDLTDSSPSSSCAASPFGIASAASAAGGAPLLRHSRSDDTLQLTIASAGSSPLAGSEALGGAGSGHCGSAGSADLALLGAPRASMDSFVAQAHHLSEGSAAEELFYRLNHARQTVDFVKRQASLYAPLSRGELGVWEALELLDSLREYETALLGDDDCDPTMSLMEHALQTAEACRLAYPEDDWLHLVGLIHDLGKLLAHKEWGSEPQWAVCGETFPVGCRFHPSILHSQFFSANPDRRRRAYSTPTGIYKHGCGLQSVYMSWSAAEYLYLVLLRNKAPLPPEALFVLRHHRSAVLLRPGAPYSELLSAFDRRCLPWVRRFRELARYTRRELQGRLEGAALREYYDGLIAKYLPEGKLRW